MSKTREPSRRKIDLGQIPVVQYLGINLQALLTAGGDRPGGLTQQQLADTMGLSLRTVGHMLKGKHAARLDSIHLAAAAFGLEPWQLLMEEFSADIALNQNLRDRVKETISSYLNAPEEARRAVDETAKLLPRRPKS